MKREQEDGFNSGWRRLGALALALIPWALGIGASVWLGVWIGVHHFRRELSQEERKAVYVGAKERPKSTIVIDVKASDCTRIVRADVDGTQLLLYAKNECRDGLTYMAWHWQLLSPDGTIIAQDYTNSCPVPVARGQVAECAMRIPVDDRASSVRAWTRQDAH